MTCTMFLSTALMLVGSLSLPSPDAITEDATEDEDNTDHAIEDENNTDQFVEDDDTTPIIACKITEDEFEDYDGETYETEQSLKKSVHDSDIFLHELLGIQADQIFSENDDYNIEDITGDDDFFRELY
mgnify:CR=1 FL=1